MLTMSGDEPVVVCWRVEELDLRTEWPGSAEYDIAEEFDLAEEELLDQ